jgi:hypothetical protein
VVSSVQTVRRLSWALVILAIVAAVLQLSFTLGIGVPPPPAEFGDFVQQLEANRLSDQAIFPLVFIQSLATLGVFLIAAFLGILLRAWARPTSLRDTMTLLFVIGGALGIAANLLNIAISNAATFGYCDCGYKTEELIAQDYALRAGWTAVSWISVGAVTLVGVGAAVGGRIIEVSPAWRTVSYLIAVVLLIAVALRVVAAFVFIQAFDPFQVSELITAFGAGILVPIWAILLARGIAPVEAYGEPAPA